MHLFQRRLDCIFSIIYYQKVEKLSKLVIKEFRRTILRLVHSRAYNFNAKLSFVIKFNFVQSLLSFPRNVLIAVFWQRNKCLVRTIALTYKLLKVVMKKKRNIIKSR